MEVFQEFRGGPAAGGVALKIYIYEGCGKLLLSAG
jgi:hypothetical protein